MTFDPNDPRLHDGSWTAKRPAHLPLPAVTPIAQAKAAADTRRVQLADIYALQGKPFLTWSPDELLGRVESMAAAAGMTRSASDTGVWASLLAMCLEGWCAAARAEELDPSSGEAA